MGRKLYIYDTNDDINREQAAGRFGDDPDVTTLPVGSIDQLHDFLANLVSNRATFDRMLVQTHGDPGTIYFGDEAMGSLVLDSDFAIKDYYKLFPGYTSIYFDGCRVAMGESGSDFLRSAGAAFLRGLGGRTFGYTNFGYGFPGWVPVIGGHTLHVLGQMKRFDFGPGGVLLQESPVSLFDPPHGRDNVGNKI